MLFRRRRYIYIYIYIYIYLNNLFIKHHLTWHYNKLYNNRAANKKEAKQ